MKISVGDIVRTPRFLDVRIMDVLDPEQALKQGYTEPTHFLDDEYDIRGHHIGLNRMVFAAVRKQEENR